MAAEFAWLAHGIKASGAGGSVTALGTKLFIWSGAAQLVWLPGEEAQVEMALPCVTATPGAVRETPDLLLSSCEGKTSHW